MNPLKMAYNPAGIRVGRVGDLNFLIDLQKQHSEALGFLPGEAIAAYLGSGRILIGQHNDLEAGYILGRPQLRYDPRIAPITQCAVAMDLKRRHLGLEMVEQWVTSAFLDGKKCVQCWCADDLDARLFWPAAGFWAVARRYPDNQRARSLTLWRRTTSQAELHADFLTLPPLAGYKAGKVGRVESLIAGQKESADSPTNAHGRPSTGFLFDMLIDDGRLTTADCFR